MKKLLTTVCLFVVTTVAIVSFIAPTVFGQEQTAKANPSPDESVTARVDKLFAQWDKPDSPGCALGIIKDGQLIYKRGYGMANLEHNVPLSTKSVFNVMSMSKQFTSTSIFLLAQQGKLSVDDEIQKYLPEVPRYQSPITIRHLLYHTSGIRNYIELINLSGMRWENVRLTHDDFLELLARQKELNHKAGEERIYNASNYFLLGQIVERVSGKSLSGFADENIFKPLGMNNTYFLDDRNSVVKNRATGYEPGGNGGFALGFIVESTGSSGLYTTVEDLFLWDQNFYNNKLGGGQNLIKEQYSTGRLNNGENAGNSTGQVAEYKGLKTVRHGGGGDGFGHEMMRFPERNFTVIRLCNAGDINTVPAPQVAEIFLADQFKKVPDALKENVAAAPDIISIPEKALASLAGLYFNPIKETTVRFYMKDGKLMIFNTALSPLSQNRFKVVGGGPPGLEIVFVRPIAGGRMQVMFKHRSGKTETFDALRSETPTSAQLTEFTGKYASDELAGATYALSIKDGKLILQVRNGITVLAYAQAGGNKASKDILLTPTFADVFFTFGESALVRFTRNQQNAVSGFTLSNVGVRRLRFNKQ